MLLKKLLMKLFNLNFHNLNFQYLNYFNIFNIKLHYQITLPHLNITLIIRMIILHYKVLLLSLKFMVMVIL